MLGLLHEWCLAGAAMLADPFIDRVLGLFLVGTILFMLFGFFFEIEFSPTETAFKLFAALLHSHLPPFVYVFGAINIAITQPLHRALVLSYDLVDRQP